MIALTKEISKSSQIADILRREIFAGNLKPGEPLDSVRALSVKFGVGRQVILSAFKILSKEQLLEGKVGSGTFVRDGSISGNTLLCRIAYVIVEDDNHNKFYASIFNGLCKNCKDKMLLLYENVKNEELFRIASECDALAVTGNLNNRTLEFLKSCGKKYVTIGNRYFSSPANNIHFALGKNIRYILDQDFSHNKSVGMILGSAALPSTRTIIDEAERYSSQYDLPWSMDSVVCTNSVYGTEEIERQWGEHHGWPQRLIVTLHSYLGLVQFLMENHIPETKYPEITVMVDDMSFLPLPYPRFQATAYQTNSIGVAPHILTILENLISGVQTDGFSAEYDAVCDEVLFETL